MKSYSSKAIATILLGLIAFSPVVALAQAAPPATTSPAATPPDTAPKPGGDERKEHKKHKKHKEHRKDEKDEKTEKPDANDKKWSGLNFIYSKPSLNS